MLPELVAQLKTLHLYGMATALGELGAERTRQPDTPDVWIKRLIEAETVDRQASSLRYQLNIAKFPIHRDLTGFDWGESRVARAQMEQFATAQFMAQAHNPAAPARPTSPPPWEWLPSIRASGFVSTMPSISSTAWNGKNAQARQVRWHGN